MTNDIFRRTIMGIIIFIPLTLPACVPIVAIDLYPQLAILRSFLDGLDHCSMHEKNVCLRWLPMSV